MVLGAGLWLKVGTIAAIVAAVTGVWAVVTNHIGLHRGRPLLRFLNAGVYPAPRRPGHQQLGVEFQYGYPGPIRIKSERWSVRKARPWPLWGSKVEGAAAVHGGDTANSRSYRIEVPAQPPGTRVTFRLKIELEPHGRARFRQTFTLGSDA